MTTEEIAELREAAYDYAHLIQVENFDRSDIAVIRAYMRLRSALGEPVHLAEPPFTIQEGVVSASEDRRSGRSDN
jgi:hypothetical protein